MDNKSIKVSEEVYKKLWDLKWDLRVKSMDDVLKYLLKKGEEA